MEKQCNFTRRISEPSRKVLLPPPPPDPHIDGSSQKPEGGSSTFHRRTDLPESFDRLLDYAEREENFYKLLNETISSDCKKLKSECDRVSANQQDSDEVHVPNTTVNRFPEYCTLLRRECEEFIEPLQSRLAPSISAALAAYDAIEQLNRLHAILDDLCSIQEQIYQRKGCLRYVQELCEQKRLQQKETCEFACTEGAGKQSDDDIDIELNNTYLLNAILAAGNSASIKRSGLKKTRERSKSVVTDDLSLLHRYKDMKGPADSQYRRQSTFSEGKSKISKWTKVKAAFKWERANVPALNECSRLPSNITHGTGLTPVNHEVARYLRVPSIACGGGSSADSILSSSSGHILSEAGTPGTVSSDSSIDDTEGSHYTVERDLSKNDALHNVHDATNVDSLRKHSLEENVSFRNSKKEISSYHELKRPSLVPKADLLIGAQTTLSSATSDKTKELQKYNVHMSSGAMPKNEMTETKTHLNRTKPPRPLDLNLRHDWCDSDSPNLLKSPKEVSSSPSSSGINRVQKLQSPVNSSVPSSPSRHSEFFPEFESEEISSGEFSEPTTPHYIYSRENFLKKQEEINQRYRILRENLNKEFENKRRDWEKLKTTCNASMSSAYQTVSSQRTEDQPAQKFKTDVTTKQLEESLTPDFRKKLQKWRVKKQISVSGNCSPQHHYHSSATATKECEAKTKIDWNLWKTGQIKLDGQGLSALPDQRDLPEEFQKKLEQWNKMKRDGSISQDTIKRSAKNPESSKKCFDYERSERDKQRSEKFKFPEKDKLEKLSKLKAIVADPRVKEIEVKTTAGVMKFEGISRKFTRKLYEWEKARGIGPESSTFALLHPGYCPIDVGRISKESHNNDNSPTLSRSLSLDSISHNILITSISQQASSLSLNNVDELKDMEDINGDARDHEFKKFDEPEAVMVEVEDHIVETASPLVTVHSLFERHTPVYKYAEVSCGDYCKTKSIQSYESFTNAGPLNDALNQIEDELIHVKKICSELSSNKEIYQCGTLILDIRKLYSNTAHNLINGDVMNAISDVLCHLNNLHEMAKDEVTDEACCQELIMQCNKNFISKVMSLNEALKILWQCIELCNKRPTADNVPDINLTSEDGYESTLLTNCDMFNSSLLENNFSTTLEATDELSASVDEVHFEGPTRTNANVGKKKLRLRKIDSRQNSKTESDTSDEELASVVETPRRTRRKGCRLKQRSFDEDGEDNKGKSFQQSDIIKAKITSNDAMLSKDDIHTSIDASENKTLPLATEKSHIFVQTKRKMFTTIEEPRSSDGLVVVERDLDGPGLHLKVCHDLKTPLASSTLISDSQSSVETLESIISQHFLTKGRLQFYSLRKSSSADNSNAFSMKNNNTSRKCYGSYESIYSKRKDLWSVSSEMDIVRAPLASDSFRVINTAIHSCYNTVLKTNKTSCDYDNKSYCQKKEHLFKKNTEKPHHNLIFSKGSGSTDKRIGTKAEKASSDVEKSWNISPDKSDNTIPRISRKLDKKSLTPTNSNIVFEYPVPISSEPTTPLHVQVNRPRTPLSERAQRIQRAKEEFLRGICTDSLSQSNRSDNGTRDESWSRQRRSHRNITSAAVEQSNLLKSKSVGMITAATGQEGEGIDIQVDSYDSLPRTVSRSGKLTTKLGFATLASKLRRVKIRKGKEFQRNSGALSALCKQSLLVDVITNFPKRSDSPSASDNLMKSKSSQAAIGGLRSTTPSDVQTEQQVDQLNKSKSEQNFKRKKESCV